MNRLNKEEREKVKAALSKADNPFVYKLNEKDAKEMEEALNDAALRKAKKKHEKKRM